MRADGQLEDMQRALQGLTTYGTDFINHVLNEMPEKTYGFWVIDQLE